MKQLDHELRYDGATVAEVSEMLGTPAFREAVCAFQGFSRHEVTVEPAGAGRSVRIDQYRAADEVPSFAKKFVGPEINIVQEEQWSSSTEAEVRVVIPGKPGDMAGTVRLVEDETGVTEVVGMAIKVNIPLVGGKAEDFIAGMLRKALKAENKVGVRWLAGERG